MINLEFSRLSFESAIQDFNRFHPNARLVEYRHFSQIWTDTSCGFGGIAGQGFTYGAVTVFVFMDCSDMCADVYSNGSLLYRIKNPTSEFWNDVKRCQMTAKIDSSKYRRKENEVPMS